MRVFLTYLWKEWRDHRTVLVGMLVAVPLLMAVMGLAAPKKELGEAERLGFATFLAVACLALFVISLATDLVPGETRRGHRWFLERLPGGLGAAFRAKLALFAAGGALFAAYGYLVAAVMCRILAGGWPPLPTPGSTTAFIAVAALWTFAVSCALPRGALSLPAVAALALLLALPALGLWMLFPSRGPEAWWRWESGALWAAGAVAAAWVAFRRRGFLRAGRACLVVGAVCAMPYWADAAHDAWNWHRHSVVEIQEEVLLGEGGNYAFINRLRVGAGNGFSPVSPVIVDLRTGNAREVGDKLSRFETYAGGPVADRALVWLFRAGSRPASIIFDGRTGEERADFTTEVLEAAWRACPVGRLPDGRAAWMRGGTLVTEAKGGGVTVLLKDASPCGLGFESWVPRGYYDLARGRGYSVRDVKARGERLWIRPGAWLTRKKNEYQLLDPDTDTLAPALGFAGVGDVVTILDDGRVLAACKGETLAVIAPETGEVTRVATPPGFETCFVWWKIRTPVRTPDGRRVFPLVHNDGVSQMTADRYVCAFVRQDGDAFVATAPVRGLVTLLGCPTDDTVLVHDDRAIYRLRFGSDVCEEIWHAR